MDPITMIVMSLATGAAAALKDTAGKAIKDAYNGIKTLIKDKYADVDLTRLEKKPESEARRDVVKEDLKEAGAQDDQQLLEKVQALLDAVAQHDPASAQAIGVDLENVRAVSLKIASVRSTGTGVKIRKGEFTGDIDIGDVTAGTGHGTLTPPEGQ